MSQTTPSNTSQIRSCMSALRIVLRFTLSGALFSGAIFSVSVPMGAGLYLRLVCGVSRIFSCE